MQFLTAFLLAATAVSATAIKVRDASAVTRSGRLVLRGATPAGLCPGIDTPVCCQVDVDGVADLTCDPPSKVPGSTKEFIATCAKLGLTAECCTLDVDGTGLICTTQEA